MLLQNFLEESALKYPNKVALICKDARLAYAEINRHANQLAALLRSHGIKRGDRVAIFLDNSVEAVVSIFGTLKADAVFVVLNPLLKAPKLKYILNDCSVKIIISDSSKLNAAVDVLGTIPGLQSVICTGYEKKVKRGAHRNIVAWAEAEALSGSEEPLKSANIDMDLAAIIYTSGSTGIPKGVMLTHHNMISAATSITSYLENVPDDIVINVLPLSFDYGLYQVLMAFKFGGTLVLEKSFVYPYEVLKKMVEEKVTGFPGVPTMFAIMLRMNDLKRYDLKSLRYITNTAAALPLKHIRFLRDTFPQAKIYSMYGLTECKRVSFLPPVELDRRPESVGKCMPNMEGWIMGGNGNRLGPSMVGELVVRGPNVMKGYWGDPDGTDEVLKPGILPGEKVLYTGDLFRTDEEGFLYFVGRKDDMIKTRGERVSPKEIENTIYELEGVDEVAVITLPDEILGRAIKAFIVPRNGYRLTERNVFSHCKIYLEEFAIPKYFEFRETLPKNPSGKIDKLLLKEESK
ncbi:MAG TPA: AMP-binding protein [Syntrophales bacterium]|nr:AMP-binding protein [Syntrophales bacterium]